MEELRESVTTLRWFLSFALHIPTAHDFCVISARKSARAHVHNVRDFPQTKLDSEKNAPFLLNEHGDPHFLLYKFNENNILNNWEKNWQKSMATFLANEINATERDITGPSEQVQFYLTLSPNYVFFKGQNNPGYLKTFILGRRWINNQRKSNSVLYKTPHWKIIALICCTQRSPKVTLITIFVSIVASTVTPSFYYVFNISLSCNYSIPSFIGNLWQVLLLGNHLKVRMIAYRHWYLL